MSTATQIPRYSYIISKYVPSSPIQHVASHSPFPYPPLLSPKSLLPSRHHTNRPSHPSLPHTLFATNPTPPSPPLTPNRLTPANESTQIRRSALRADGGAFGRGGADPAGGGGEGEEWAGGGRGWAAVRYSCFSFWG